MSISVFPQSCRLAALTATVMAIATPFSAFAATVLVNSFVGSSQRDTIPLAGQFNPPDVNGTVGTTQYAQLQNGVYAVYDKNTGALQAPRISDNQFFINAGGTATGGDVRILFDPTSRRYIAIGFGAADNVIQIAVSTTDNALGPFRATSFISAPSGALADFPTLALAGNRVVIGTANFTSDFVSTTLSVFNRSDIFAAGGPTVGSLTQFVTPSSIDNGFNIQAANRAPDGSNAFNVVAGAFTANSLVTYSVTADGTRTPTVRIGSQYNPNDLGRQPDLLNTGNARVADTSDDRIASSVFEVGGRIYSVHTVTPTGQDHTVARITVQNATTRAVLSETDITGPDDSYDYYNPSLAVNSSGQLVVGYVRSGDSTHPIDGRISIFARSFNTNANGTLASTSGDVLIKQSPVDDFHQGSPQGQPAVGGQRLGDYSSVSLDPTNSQRFYVINQFADFFNNAAGGNPRGDGSSRYGTFIGIIGIDALGGGGVPEPATWAMMITGFGFVGGAARRRRAQVKVSFA